LDVYYSFLGKSNENIEYWLRWWCSINFFRATSISL